MLPALMKVLAAVLQLSACSAAASCMDTGSCALGSDQTSLLQVKSVLEAGFEREPLSSSVGCPVECSERAALEKEKVEQDSEQGVVDEQGQADLDDLFLKGWRIPCKSNKMKQCRVCKECLGTRKKVTFGGTRAEWAAGAETQWGGSSCPPEDGFFPMVSGQNPLWFQFVESVNKRLSNPHAVDEFCAPRHLVRHELRYCCSTAEPSPEDLKNQLCRVLATTGAGLDRGTSMTTQGESWKDAQKVAKHFETYHGTRNQHLSIPRWRRFCQIESAQPHGGDHAFPDDIHHQPSAPGDEVSPDDAYKEAKGTFREQEMKNNFGGDADEKEGWSKHLSEHRYGSAKANHRDAKRARVKISSEEGQYFGSTEDEAFGNTRSTAEAADRALHMHREVQAEAAEAAQREAEAQVEKQRQIANAEAETTDANVQARVTIDRLLNNGDISPEEAAHMYEHIHRHEEEQAQ